MRLLFCRCYRRCLSNSNSGRQQHKMNVFPEVTAGRSLGDCPGDQREMANWELATCLLCLCGGGTSSLLTFISVHNSLPFLDTHLHWQLPVRVEFEPTAGAAHSQGLLLLGRQSRTEHRAQSCFKFIFMLPLGAVYRNLSDFIRNKQATPPVGHSRMPPTNDRQTDRRTDLN